MITWIEIVLKASHFCSKTLFPRMIIGDIILIFSLLHPKMLVFRLKSTSISACLWVIALCVCHDASLHSLPPCVLTCGTWLWVCTQSAVLMWCLLPSHHLLKALSGIVKLSFFLCLCRLYFSSWLDSLFSVDSCFNFAQRERFFKC